MHLRSVRSFTLFLMLWAAMLIWRHSVNGRNSDLRRRTRTDFSLGGSSCHEKHGPHLLWEGMKGSPSCAKILTVPSLVNSTSNVFSYIFKIFLILKDQCLHYLLLMVLLLFFAHLHFPKCKLCNLLMIALCKNKKNHNQESFIKLKTIKVFFFFFFPSLALACLHNTYSWVHPCLWSSILKKLSSVCNEGQTWGYAWGSKFYVLCLLIFTY